MNDDFVTNQRRARGLQQLHEITHLLREKVDPELPAQTLIALLTVARKPGCRVTDVAAEQVMTLSAASRSISNLSSWRSADRPGHGLVEMVENRENRREKLLYLTPSGHHLIAGVLELL